MDTLSFRQIHLDFHTSPHISDVGADFDPVRFAATFTRAQVSSVTLFARCHHGLSYYPSAVTPVHPGLQRPDLMGDMIQALHGQGIRAPIYVTVGWDEHAAMTHQDWLAVDRRGSLVGRTPLDVSERWRWLCLNTGYADYLAAQVQELLERYPVDGFFFDIVRQPSPGCVCNTCLTQMEVDGIDPQDDQALTKYSLVIARRLMDRLSSLTRQHHPDATLFYNSRTRLEALPERGMRPELSYMSHIEIESLPGGRWGYNHFPLFVRYFRPLIAAVVGQTGRFHRTWGDFGGVRAQAALEYEIFSMLASGARCSIGDQLHPRGVLEEPVYERIGAVYASVAAKEPWCAAARPLAELGVLLTTSRTAIGDVNKAAEADEGALRMLLELRHQFEVIDREADFTRYRVLICPDVVSFDDQLADKIRSYLSQGGKLLLTGASGLTPHGAAFALDEIGLDYLGPPEFDPDYVLPGESVGQHVPRMPLVQYGGSHRVRPRAETEVLSETVAPYFQRTWRHYSSHAQTPYDRPTGLPAATRTQNVVYVAAPLFTAYARHAYPIHRQLLGNYLALLLPRPLVRAALPTGGQATLLEQPDGRRIAHLLYYVWQRRAPDLDVIEDVVPVYDVELEVRTGHRPQRVYLAPEGRDLEFELDERTDVVRTRIPVVRGHQMVVFEP